MVLILELILAKKLSPADFQVVLIDRHNYHTFQPLLYQVATGGLSPTEISAPIRTILKDQQNTKVIMADVIAVFYQRYGAGISAAPQQHVVAKLVWPAQLPIVNPAAMRHVYRCGAAGLL